jgi:hypothetical protein
MATTIYKVPAQAGITHLYHYQKFEPDHLASLLIDQKIYCSDPSSVNDPWDFQPWFDYRPMLNNPENLERMFGFFRTAAGPEVVNNPLRPIFEEHLRNNPDALQRFIDKSSAGLGEELCKRRLYCLTPLPDSTLMWSHYAASHTGICLEFGTDNQLFGAALAVRYSPTYPEWTPQDARERHLTQLILTKSDDWQYEQEYRLIASPFYPDGIPIKLEGQFLHLPTGALTAVIVGCKAEFNVVAELVHNCQPSLPIKRALRVPNHYRLQIVGADQ